MSLKRQLNYGLNLLRLKQYPITWSDRLIILRITSHIQYWALLIKILYSDIPHLLGSSEKVGMIRLQVNILLRFMIVVHWVIQLNNVLGMVKASISTNNNFSFKEDSNNLMVNLFKIFRALLLKLLSLCSFFLYHLLYLCINTLLHPC